MRANVLNFAQPSTSLVHVFMHGHHFVIPPQFYTELGIVQWSSVRAQHGNHPPAKQLFTSTRRLPSVESPGRKFLYTAASRLSNRFSYRHDLFTVGMSLSPPYRTIPAACIHFFTDLSYLWHKPTLSPSARKVLNALRQKLYIVKNSHLGEASRIMRKPFAEKIIESEKNTVASNRICAVRHPCPCCPRTGTLNTAPIHTSRTAFHIQNNNKPLSSRDDPKSQ